MSAPEPHLPIQNEGRVFEIVGKREERAGPPRKEECGDRMAERVAAAGREGR